MSNNPLALRPHHGLCLRFFSGSGYSGDFCRNMGEIQRHLTPETTIRLCAGPDTVCADCPNLASGCPNAARYDESILSLCNISAGEVWTWRDLQKCLFQRILQQGLLSEICGDCQWADLCQKALESNK